MARRRVAMTCLSALILAAAGPTAASEVACGGVRQPYKIRMAEPYSPGPDMIAVMEADLRRRRIRLAAPTKLTVKTLIHVISDGRRELPKASVDRQIEILNAAYGGRMGGADTRLRFRVDEVTRTVNPDWYGDPLTHEVAMKKALHRGGPETLNLYIAQLSEEVLGYSTYPYWYTRFPGLDGVVIDWRTLPGGVFRHFNYGYTGVHEIGHWLGLLHTFESGCKAPGDHVADTPPEGWPTEGCPLVKDTCRGGGADPIHNFMDYAHDRCMREFTAGQATRMHQVWQAYRVRPPV